MILTDIYVSALNETYDFQLEETVPVDMIREEIVEVLKKKAGGPLRKDQHPFFLCSYEKQEILNGSLTLQECGIKNGSRLMIV